VAFDGRSSFARIGSGSIGGKARGLAFAAHLLDDSHIVQRFAGIRVAVPASVVLGTEVFEAFIERNGLRDFAIGCDQDDEIARRFLAASLPRPIEEDLAAYLEAVRHPIAVRSSSLLEDSLYQPFAGTYATCMLANDHPVSARRLDELVEAIKRVYASTFSQHAKAYLAATPYRLEEEKMAVILQKLVGAPHHGRFYPDFAGVARSYNHYPVPPMQPAEGIAAVALGFGATVVEGRVCLRFCPRHPRHVAQFSSVRDTLRNSQRQFAALPLEPRDAQAATRHAFELRRFGLDAAEEDGTLASVGSTYSAENDRIDDGVARRGVRLVSFAPILKHSVFPLADILDALLQMSKAGTSTEVEIEFAVNLSPPSGQPLEFGFLQLRPMGIWQQAEDADVRGLERSRLICESASVFGHGRIDDVHDVIVVDMHRFDRGRSREVAREVMRYNALLAGQGRPYVLVGVGRWGSADPLLGIPVGWDQIAGARVIVEAGFKDIRVAPSQGTHFFQNLVASSVGYFTVNPDAGEGFVDWAWLAAQAAESETDFVRHLRFTDPVVVRMDGRRNEGVIVKPAACVAERPLDVAAGL
jgi:hypothetical protein